MSYSFLTEERINGRTYRVLDPRTAPTVRVKAFQLEEYSLRKWGLSGDHLLSYANNIIEATKIDMNVDMQEYFRQMDEGRMKAHQMSVTLKEVVENEVKYIPYIKGACTIIVVDDEPVESMPAEFIEKKMELIADDQVEHFFLKTILGLWEPTLDSQTISEMLDSLKMDRQKYSLLISSVLSNVSITHT